MHVNMTAGDVARAEAIQRAQAAAALQATTDGATDGATEGAEATAPPRTDAVQISDAGRALAIGSAATSDAAPDIEATRANELRTKVFTGAYNTLGMADQVARAIIRSGDL